MPVATPFDAAGLLTIPAADGTPAQANVTVTDSDHPIGAACAAIGGEPVLASPAARSSDTVISGDVVLRAGGVPLLVSTVNRGGRTVVLNRPLFVTVAAEHRVSSADGFNRGMARGTQSVSRGADQDTAAGAR
jgi:hypothetical protein